MDQVDRLVPGEPGTFLPQTMVEVGDTQWTLVSPLIARRLEEMAAGDVLEVSSRQPGHRNEALAWCDASGHDLFQMVADGNRTWFWIKKR